MKKEIICFLLIMLLITPIVIGKIEEKKENIDIVITENLGKKWMWVIGAWTADHTYGTAVSIGEADNANDGPPQDSYDQLKGPLTDSAGALYSIDGFGKLASDYRKHPDTQKLWHLYYEDTPNPRNVMITIDWDVDYWFFDYGGFEYGKCIFYVHDGNQHINMYDQDTYTYFHNTGVIDHFEVRLYENQAPNKPETPSGPETLTINQMGEYCSSSIDPDDDQVKIRFKWGDGEISDWTNYLPSGDPAFMSHSWSEPGTYEVRAEAIDEYGHQSVWSSIYTVTITGEQQGEPPEQPVIIEAPDVMAYGETYEFSAVTTDPDGDEISYAFTWDYEGDWTLFESDFMPSGEECIVAQSFDSPGHTMHMTMDVGAVDTNGLLSDFCEPIHMQISDPPEHVYINGPSKVKKGEEQIYHITGYDPNFNDLVDFNIEWGDGESEFISDIGIMEELDIGHTWEQKGNFDISVTIFDFNGLGGPTETLSVSVPYSFNYQNKILQNLFEKAIEIQPIISKMFNMN